MARPALLDAGAKRVPGDLLDLHAPAPRCDVFAGVEPLQDANKEIHLPADIDAFESGERFQPGKVSGRVKSMSTSCFGFVATAHAATRA